MGSTSKVFDNPQHEYTKMLLASVPQLHKKWDARLDGPEQGERGAPHSESNDTKEDIANPRERYSKSALHPLARRGRIAQGRMRQVHEQREIDGPDRSIKTDAYLRSNEELPQLIEIEDDHYVARPVGAR
jgi:ABC-type glutathione transport system ATPase component